MEDDRYDDEINLKPYLLATFRRWYVIALFAVLFALLAGIWSRQGQEQYRSTAAILALGNRPELQLDGRYDTANELRQDRAVTRVGLYAMATHPAIATFLPPEVVTALLADDDIPAARLVERISAHNTGDFIFIDARGTTPEKAQLLADSWAEAYVSYVNSVYGVNEQSLQVSEQQVEQAQQSYEQAQQTVEEFIAVSGIDLLEDRVDNLASLIDSNLKANRGYYVTLINRSQQLGGIQRDVEALQSELGSGGPLGVGKQLSALGLRLQSVGGIAAGLQLQLTSLAGSELPQGELEAELEQLRQSIVEQRGSLQQEIDRLESAIALGAPTTAGSLSAEQLTRYYDELGTLRRLLEEKEGTRRALEQERNIALEALQVVERRRAEQQVIRFQPALELRRASAAFYPIAPVPRGTIRNMVLGGVSGAMVGTVVALGMSVYAISRREQEPSIQRPLDQPVAG